ncbi:MAG TPA: peptidoglycan DD-metalloendopeptidase family protein [Rhizobiales bacterium]|nr:peptidoglycan DD-metalloendopeptidase family protein [Hyphomicrobiales bacterium]
MRFSVLRVDERSLLRSVAVIVIGGIVAGCSSGASRFTDGVDGIFTASTANQRSIIRNEAQPYPGDAARPKPATGDYTGSVSRDAVKPVDLTTSAVTRSSLPDAQPKAAAPVAAVRLDSTTTATVQPAPSLAAQPEAEETVGWSRAGGTQITVRDGETVYNLSRRYGVPANVLLSVNGLPDANALKAGQKIVIPTYVYSRRAPVSAPDSDPNVADARSSRGTKFDIPADKVPLPSRAPAEKVAILPQSPKVKENEPPASGATAKAEPLNTAGKDGAGKGSYVVQAGDTLSAIAKKTGVPVTAIKSANGMKDGFVRIGQTLVIPQGSPTVAAAKPGADPIVTGTAGPAKKASDAQVTAYTPPRAAEKVIEDAERVEASAPDATGIGRMRWPVRGRVINAFGSKNAGKANDGIDIAVPEGTPVKAAENGVVIYAGDGLKEFGNTVLVRHEDGLVTVYGHASEIKVSRGEKVKRGQEIARSGMSGSADMPKLHFEVRKNSAPVDPSTYLE